MTEAVLFNCLLVPTDFSAHAKVAYEHALDIIGGDDADLIVVHAMDPAIVDQMTEVGIVDREEIVKRMREHAQQQLEEYSAEATDSVNIVTLVCEGEPFLEVIRKADEFDVDAIVMSKGGLRNHPTALLFGSTAEKVIRGSRKPVVVLPVESAAV